MSDPCAQTRYDFTNLACSLDDLAVAEAVALHLRECEPCRAAAAEYQAIRAALKPADTPPTPPGGWNAFDQRLALTARTPRRSWWRPPALSPALTKVAAGLLIALTLFNVALLLRPASPRAPVESAAANHPPAPQLSDALVAKAFATVAHEFEGRATWVMLSPQDNDLGLSPQPVAATDLLILQLNLSRGPTTISQIQLAIVPGETARVSVPSTTGEYIDYVISTDARDLHHIGLSMAVAGSKTLPDGADLGTMATSVTIGYGHHTQAGQILTREGTYDLSLSLQHRQVDTPGV